MKTNVCRQTRLVCSALMLLLATGAFTQDWSGFPAGAAAYGAEVSAINREHAGAGPESLTRFLELATQLASVLEQLAGDFVDDPGQAYDDLVAPLIAERSALVDSVDPANMLVRREDTAYAEYVDPFIDRNVMIPETRVRNELFERKYFHGEDDNGNLFEAILNSYLPFLRYDSEDAWYREQGISRFEAVFLRAEPIVAVWDGESIPDLGETDAYGALATLGLLWHFLPQVSQSDGEITDTVFSKYVKRVGMRGGVGITFADRPQFMWGGGLSAAAFTVWGLYNQESEQFVVAVGVNDLATIDKYLPWFGR
jgi:hypothetical protein